MVIDINIEVNELLRGMKKKSQLQIQKRLQIFQENIVNNFMPINLELVY